MRVVLQSNKGLWGGQIGSDPGAACGGSAEDALRRCSLNLPPGKRTHVPPHAGVKVVYLWSATLGAPCFVLLV